MHNTPDPTAIVANMHAGIVTESTMTPIKCVMAYDAASPFEVVFVSKDLDDGEIAEWHYARDLLHAALLGEEEELHGEGDVIVTKEQGFIFTLLKSDDVAAIVCFLTEDIQTFLNYTETLVPFGQESIEEGDLDEALREFLGE